MAPRYWHSCWRLLRRVQSMASPGNYLIDLFAPSTQRPRKHTVSSYQFNTLYCWQIASDKLLQTHSAADKSLRTHSAADKSLRTHSAADTFASSTLSCWHFVQHTQLSFLLQTHYCWRVCLQITVQLTPLHLTPSSVDTCYYWPTATDWNGENWCRK